MPVIDDFPEDDLPDLDIAVEKVRFIIIKARQYDAKESDSDPSEGSNATDDGMADVLEDDPENDAVRGELVSLINALDVDEKATLVALAWIGRGTYEIEDWEEALQTARDEHGKRTAQYLLEMPLLGDYLAEGLEAFGEDFDDEDDAELEDDVPDGSDNT